MSEKDLGRVVRYIDRWFTLGLTIKCKIVLQPPRWLQGFTNGMMGALDSGMEQRFEITSRSHGGLVGRWTAGQVREIMREARSRGGRDYVQ